MENLLYRQHILRAGQFDQAILAEVFEVARGMREVVETKGRIKLLERYLMTALFYEASSRTFASFLAAMQRLGGGIIPLQGMAYSSVTKGETLEDTVRTFGSYTD